MKTFAHKLASDSRRFCPVLVLHPDHSAQLRYDMSCNLEEICEVTGFDEDLFYCKDGEYVIDIPREVNSVIVTQAMVDAMTADVDTVHENLLEDIDEPMSEYLETVVECMAEQYQLCDTQRDALLNSLSWKLILN